MGKSKKADSQMCCKCQYDDKLEKYKVLYTAYADEIRNLWTRSIFLGAFMTLAWGGYGALQLKFITRKCDEFDIFAYICTSLGICLVIIVLSLLWIAMAKGSKFVQEAHEDKIKQFVENNESLQELYCKLDDYEYPNAKKILGNKQMNLNLKDGLFVFGQLKAFRYSPSKINIALGWISAFVAILLIIVYMLMWLYCIKFYCFYTALVTIATIFIFTILILLLYFMKNYLKGGN